MEYVDLGYSFKLSHDKFINTWIFTEAELKVS